MGPANKSPPVVIGERAGKIMDDALKSIMVFGAGEINMKEFAQAVTDDLKDISDRASRANLDLIAEEYMNDTGD